MAGNCRQAPNPGGGLKSTVSKKNLGTSVIESKRNKS